ncbi:hypothetical protein BVY03_00990 [bacterium K02(2017)]|nr:hypothetical protein BVY03_00990 [bacterium K02(2017)]
MDIYGFYSVIGALGMIGVVVNDAIVMIDRLENWLKTEYSQGDIWTAIAKIASTRLKPIIVTTITTVVAILPTAYGLAGFDSFLADMMLTMGWGLAFSTLVTLFLVPSLYSFIATSSLKKTQLIQSPQ